MVDSYGFHVGKHIPVPWIRHGFRMFTKIRNMITPPKFNIEPENSGFQ